MESQGYEVQPYVLPAASVNAPHKRDRVWFVAFKNTKRNGRIQREPEQEGAENWEQRNACTGDSIGVCGEKVAGVTSDAESKQSERLRLEQREFSEPQQGEFRGNGGEVGNGATPDAEHSGGKRRQGFGGIQSKTVGQPKQANPSGVFGKNGTTPGAPDIGLQQPRGAWERWAGFTHNGSVPDWGNFPQTQPTICTGDDGLSTQLDGITFSKWRNESIKAAGNAIVPQVAYQIFRAIELYEIQNGAK